MGTDPRDSVLDPSCRSWEVPNLYVTDGACWPTSGWQNPTLTEMAVTARACDHAVDQLRRGEISKLASQHHVQRLLRGDVLACTRKPSAGRSMPARRCSPLPSSDRRDREVHLVDQPGAQVLADGRDAAAEADVLARAAASRARSSAASMPSVTKWKVVPPSIASGARG